MPKATSITKEIIIDAAFDIVRTEGFTALSARNVSKKIGCSTQPIYCAYQNMDDLKQDVINKMTAHLEHIMQSYRKSGMLFLDYGLGYIYAAYTEPVLFKSIYVDNILGLTLTDIVPDDSLIQVMKQDESTSQLTDEELINVARKGWIFVHGYASLIAAGMLVYDEERAEQMLLTLFYDRGYDI